MFQIIIVIDLFEKKGYVMCLPIVAVIAARPSEDPTIDSYQNEAGGIKQVAPS